jgi:hypothetical protein
MHSAILPMMMMAAGSSGDYLAARHKQTEMHLLRFKWRNQRQERKNRRRAHAAGKSNAFA